MEQIKLAITDSDIQRCFPALKELRPFLKEEEFLPRIKRMMQNGFQLVFVELENGKVPAVGGFRREEMLHRGKSIYLDDLSTMEEFRSSGYGGKIIDYLIDLAKKENCATLHLDSGVQRFDAHRFYLKKGFNIISHHFAIQFKPVD